MITINKINYKLINIILIMILLLIGFYNIKIGFDIINKLFLILIPFIIAFIISYIVNPIIKKLISIGFNKGISITLVMVTFISFIGIFFILVIPIIYDNLFDLSKHIISFVNTLSIRYSIDMDYFIKYISVYIEDRVDVFNISSLVIDIINTSFSVVIQIILCFISTIYFLIYYDKIICFIYNRLSKCKVYLYIIDINKYFRLYTKSIFMIMFIQFLYYLFFFFIIGHPDYLIIAIIACFTTVIPIIGGVITNVVALTSSFYISGLFIKVVILCLLLPILENYIINPRIYNKFININPLISIILMTLMISLFGIIGVFITIPLYIVIYCVFNRV